MEELWEVIEVDHVKAAEVRGGDVIAYDGRARQIVLLDRTNLPAVKIILADSIDDRRQVIFDQGDVLEVIWRDRQGSNT